MKTEDLIAAMVADTNHAPAPGPALRRSVVISVVLAAAMFFAVLGPRPDIEAALQTIRFDFKFVFTLGVLLSAVFVAVRFATPSRHDKKIWWPLMLAPLLLVVAIGFELSGTAPGQWRALWIGHNAVLCILCIPLLSFLPLLVVLFAMRSGAPAHPAIAGALAGLIAGGVGATFYAAHCVDDSPLFVATWYGIALGLLAGMGAVLGARVLRW